MKNKIISSGFVVLLLLLTLSVITVAGSFVTWPSNTINVDYPPTNIIVADNGVSYVTNNYGGIMKYLPDGTLDTAWGESGKAVELIRPIFLSFDEQGNILTGSADFNSGVIRISAQSGESETIIEDIKVAGIAVGKDSSIYINSGSNLLKYSKYNDELKLIWEKPLISNNEMGISILPDGSIVTTSEMNGSVQKYTPDGNIDSSFGTDGVLAVSNSAIGFASYNNELYVSCYGEGVIKRILPDGQNVEPVMTGTSPTILVAKGGFYFITNWLNNSIDSFEMPNLDIEKDQFSYTVTPTTLPPGSTDVVTLDIFSDSTAEYEVTANVFDQDSNLLITDITATTTSLVDGDATIVLTPPVGGWPAGVYYIEIVFTDNVDGITVSASLRVDTNIAAVNQYTVTFVGNGGSSVPAQVEAYDSLVTEPAPPVRTGYTFAGWYSEEELTTAWDFAADKVPAEDITLYAGWDINEYTVSLDSRGGSAADSITAEYGSMISEPPAPEKAGYTFEGWYTDESLEVAWDFAEDTVPASDITLYAKWEISTYNVTFKDWDGSILKTETIEYGSSATAPAAPTKTGYTFSGWDTGFGNITSNLSVTAEYEQNAVSPSVSVVSERVQTKVKGLDEAVDVSEDLAAGKDVEIALELDLLTVETVPEEDREAINSKLTSEPFGEGVKSFYLDISLFKILREEGAETREKLSETASFIAITLTIPEDQRDGTDYRVLRVHDGVAEYLDTIYDSDNYTLTFETDRFSTYAIAYTPPGEAPVEETQDEQDEEQGKLPETGLNNWILIILGLVLIMAGIVLQRRYANKSVV
ncbi:InlB B-repeat-containing protein [Dethiobacter alkaliphilus]|uniref:InlB B-repeat-containing protein n=1 Tax=Dethiobacter alkaliphilus TaxID=427926 RepID=UPI002227F013|nr:InlB B-repeat-containing protein [Dethiobacter alkaliphilus]MCW3491003.1 InlB B-repeat-containing protein [Dethiobacter alkaliphilus]